MPKKISKEEFECKYAMQELCDLKGYLPQDYQEFYCNKSETLCDHYVALDMLEKLKGSEELKKLFAGCGCEK